MGSIADNYGRIRSELPPDVRIVIAAKSRNAAEVTEALDAGAGIIGCNYVQEAESLRQALGEEALQDVDFHMIGHLQRNKAGKACDTFDAIQSLDSLRLARAVESRMTGPRPMPALVQINSGDEESKYGIDAEELIGFLERVSELKHVTIKGLMTLEPYQQNPEDARKYFRSMRELFSAASEAGLPGVEMHTLSMGMSNSYRVAVEEGANMVRIGTAIFGPRRS